MAEFRNDTDDTIAIPHPPSVTAAPGATVELTDQQQRDQYVRSLISTGKLSRVP